MAAFATLEGDTLTLKGMYVTEDLRVFFETVTGPRYEAETMGADLANRMRRNCI